MTPLIAGISSGAAVVGFATVILVAILRRYRIKLVLKPKGELKLLLFLIYVLTETINTILIFYLYLYTPTVRTVRVRSENSYEPEQYTI